MHIKIVSTPEGEAPLHIREEWVGLTIPLLIEKQYECGTVGVLSGPKTWLGTLIAFLLGKTKREVGYIVNSKEAIDILEAKSTEAAMWWKENTKFYKHKGYAFMFNTSACLKK